MPMQTLGGHFYWTASSLIHPASTTELEAAGRMKEGMCCRRISSKREFPA